LKKGGDGIREENKNNNFIGKNDETNNIVGSGTIGPWIDSKLSYAVRHNSLRGFQGPGRFGHASSGVFEGIYS
jgi:hypothetical protein